MIKKNVVGIVTKNKKILLQLRDNKKNIVFPNSWGFFGGSVNLNENHSIAIKRELFEELNIKNFKSLKFINTYYSAKYKVIFFIYTLKLNDKIYLNEGFDCDFFNENKILAGKKSNKNGIFFKTAEVNLMKKILFLAKRFL